MNALATRCSIVVAACLLFGGCSQFADPNVPEPIRPFAEPETGLPYLLYRPSSYDRRQAWPLIVACHTSFPDSPQRQIRNWTQLAEEYGFLVVVPRLQGTGRGLLPRVEEQLRRQRSDEELIVAAVRHIRAGHNISGDRIFLYGWSGGSHAALTTGLRHPDLFRAISVAQPKFDEAYLRDVGGAVDRHQPILVCYRLSDVVTGKHASRCLAWLRSRGANLREDVTSAKRQGDCRGIVEFFSDVIRSEPLIRIRAFRVREDDPLRVQFKVRSSVEPTRYQWAFGDGGGSTAPEPIHAFPDAGTYRVELTVDTKKGHTYERTVELNVRTGSVRPAGGTPAQTP